MKERFQEVLNERASELLRESGALWLVFSVLDRFVSGLLTPAWFISNAGTALAIWFMDVYIEVRRR
jgi:hypothetical protein